MCHPVLIGVIGGVIAAKLFFRLRGGGHGCGARLDGARRCGGFARHGGDHARRGFGGASPGAGSGIKLADLAGKLELNARQSQESGEVFAKLTGAFGERVQPGTRLHGILEIISAEPFDADAAADALGLPDGVLPAPDKELLDGVEHVHNILTSEQREKLRALLT